MSGTIQIPMPDSTLRDINAGLSRFVPDLTLNDFIVETFLNEQSALFNLEHVHLLAAKIGFLWTNAPNRRRMKRVAGEAEMPNFKGGAWQKARQEQQLEEWFGLIPDFIITLDADYRFECSDIQFLALLEHELYHCGQRVDDFGLPKFSRTTGQPVFGMRGHDVEEFIGVVRRYGVAATGRDEEDFVEAALAEPVIGAARVEALCGSCV